MTRLLVLCLLAGCAAEQPAPAPEPIAAEPVDHAWDDYQKKQEEVAADLAPDEVPSADDLDWDAYEAQLDEFDAEADADAD